MQSSTVFGIDWASTLGPVSFEGAGYPSGVEILTPQQKSYFFWAWSNNFYAGVTFTVRDLWQKLPSKREVIRL